MANHAKLRSYYTALCYKYGYEVPWDYNHAVELDKCNGNTKWQASTALEMSQLHEYKTFKDMGKGGKPLMVTRRSAYTLSLMSSMMDAIKADLLLMGTSLKSHSILYTLVLFPSAESTSLSS